MAATHLSNAAFETGTIGTTTADSLQPAAGQEEFVVSDTKSAQGRPSSDELLRLMIDSAKDYAIFSMDLNGVVTSWNPGAERVLGYQEMIGQSADVIFTPEDRQAGIPDKERKSAQTQGRAEDDRWQVRSDGSYLFASGLTMPLEDRSLGYVKILRDRTEHHQAEARLRENEERFRVLATSIPQLVFRSRADGDRTWGSPQWVEFTGLGLKESVGYGWMDAIHPDDHELTHSAWRDAAASGNYYVEHRVRRHSDGEYRWHQTRARRVESDDIMNGDWVGTMTDVHDLRGLKDRQQVLMAELQHRTRNLLAVVQSIANQTLRTSTSLETFGSEYASRLRALGRVQGLLARAEKNVDLRDVVNSELAAHVNSSEDPNIRIEGQSVALPAASAQALGLALHELATNAVKHGALAQDGGKLDVVWRVLPDGRVTLEWIERDVNMQNVAQPKRKGYGSELIERALPYQLNAETRLEFSPDGVRCAITVSADQS
ncbi:PAS domain S-box-containing protein [Phyllobacterium ifriqiyense]|uniref:Blue-light-activated histidine kinase n=1 Tax=Phyllobacterium ifriqiyense TaxID=314238 RepID=A0ABU0S376_9HYPH|nr:PAS domain S-box protein [Phyllobacterium ifriqiyense]MDQ0995221.1 PAS domain S-box-containing protein [Phyllobacterium ifriqiyense]